MEKNQSASEKPEMKVAKQSLEAQFEEAVNLFLRRQYSSAESLCYDIAHQAPTLAEIHHLLALITFNLGKHETALKHAEAAVLLTPQSSDFMTCLGDIHRECGNTAKADACFKVAEKISTKNSLR